jgi:Fe-S-cluster-containing hydrogenase component 2
MSEEVYIKLAQYLDKLPGGFPSTENGIELRILRRLFTPEQAALALHLTLIAEEPHVIAGRAGIQVEQAEKMLEEMASKGLVYDRVSKDGESLYMVSQFVVGIWEYQVNNLNVELIQDVDEYFKEMIDFDDWREAPQLRTIPIGESLPAQAEVMAYEQAENLLRGHTRFAVADCICRKERNMVDEGCDKPLETCLTMGSAADFYTRHGLGRTITKDEALQILDVANQAGLVLQPGNSKRVSFLCCCCGDCCGVLRNIKRHPRPAEIVSSAYYAESDPEICSACGDCLERCQMEAILLDDGYAVVDLEHCIGCGLCVPTCSTEAMHLVRKPEEQQPYVPRNIVESQLRLARQRGVLKTRDLVKMQVRSSVDRIRTPK